MLKKKITMIKTALQDIIVRSDDVKRYVAYIDVMLQGICFETGINP